MERVIKRRNNLFMVDKTVISDRANNSTTINALYAAIYSEFKGAIRNPIYKDLTPKARMDKVNEFANLWLKDRGF